MTLENFDALLLKLFEEQLAALELSRHELDSAMKLFFQQQIDETALDRVANVYASVIKFIFTSGQADKSIQPA